MVRAVETSLSSLAASNALPLAARWFLKAQTARGVPDAGDDFWASRITPKAAAELRKLVPRFVVLFAESRRCNLVGNSGAEWGYAALSLMPVPPDDALQPRLIGQLFAQVAAAKAAHDLRPDQLCAQALRRVPHRATLTVCYEHEHPDWRLGHLMMRLQIDDEDAVSYWPALDDTQFNYANLDTLSEACSRLALRHVLPLQLATFLTVLANATADHTESWGGEHGVNFFREGNLPFVLRQLADDPEG